MGLSAPTFIVFLISFVLAGLAVAIKYFGYAVPVVDGYVFETMLAAYVVLFIGNLFKGL